MGCQSDLDLSKIPECPEVTFKFISAKLITQLGIDTKDQLE